jgi:hypothetical protein
MLELGTEVTMGGRPGRVAATSGSDSTCIVEFADGSTSGWQEMSKFKRKEIPKKKEEKEKVS